MLLIACVLLGIVLGWIRGGRLGNFLRLPIRLLWLPCGAFLLQSSVLPLSRLIPGDPDQWLWIPLLFSYGLLAVFFIANYRIPSLWILAAGLFLNGLVIACNSWRMPVPEEMAAVMTEMQKLRYICLSEETRLPFLGDIIYIPIPLLRGYASLGDLFLGAGIIWLFLSGILAGICIGLGGTVFLSLDNRVLGALFFTVGLFTICTQGLHLYTGKVCYVFEKDLSYALDLIPIWLGNLAGTFLLGMLVRCTRIAPPLVEAARGLCETKLNDSLGSIFLLAALCNVLIYIAVEGYNKNPHEIGKYLALFFGVVVFILCGFEHCVANMYYFSVAGMWSGKALVYLLVMTLGNSVGGILFPLVRGRLANV